MKGGKQLNKDSRINIRCDMAYYAMINRYAKLENMTVSEFIRKITIEYINRRKADNESIRRKSEA